jgi:DNA-binding Lrp family transcriptional regulator
MTKRLIGSFLLTGFLITAGYGQSGPPVNPMGRGGDDDITREIEGILGEAENSIMQGIKDEVMNILSDLLNVSPTSEVARLRKMMKDGFSRQQKIEYQDYKVNFEWKKAHTELSPTFVKFYGQLDLKTDFDLISDTATPLRNLLNKGVFTPSEIAAYRKIVEQVANTDDLATEVRFTVNLGQKPVWMSEGERVKVLENVREELAERHRALKSIGGELQRAYAYRAKQAYETAAAKAFYKDKTSLNRYVGAK